MNAWSCLVANGEASAQAVGQRRMAERAALRVADVFLREPMRQWVLSFPFQLCFLFASDPGVKAPLQEEWLRLTHTLSQRVARFPEKRRLLERDLENSDLVYEQQEEDVMQQLYGYSVTYSYRSGPTSSSKDFHIANLATACG